MSVNARLLGLMSREMRILLLTGGGESNDAQLRDLLAGPVQWDGLRTLLEWERTLPVSWERLKRLGVDASQDGADQIERLSRVSGFTALMLEDRLRRLIAGLESEGIPAILLKGAGLALSAYPRFADRPMGDLDVLIAPEHSKRAWELALSQGWVWDEHEYPSSHYQAHHHLPPLFDAARTGVRLELHTALSLSSHPFSLSFEQARAVSRPISERSELTRVLDPEHQLLHLAVHFAWGHLASFGIWRLARDVAALAERGIDWQRVLELSRGYKAEFAMYWSLRLADLLCGVSVAPVGVLASLAPRRSAWMLQLLERHLAIHVIAIITPCPSAKLRRAMWSMALEPNRTATSRERPWDSEPARRPTVYAGDAGVVTRIKTQLTRGRAWRRYFNVLWAT
ncbi:MAG: nucleotidyltransferase family protein [Gemmatimonadaceae bacterium]|nr:nucleotidyltransferase family protein [Gemmatimonadaceae bacterium]